MGIDCGCLLSKLRGVLRFGKACKTLYRLKTEQEGAAAWDKLGRTGKGCLAITQA